MRFLSIGLLVIGMLCGIYLYWHFCVDYYRIKTKEEAFQTILKHQNEYERIVQDMEVLLQESGRKAVILRNKSEYKANGLGGSIAMKYSIYSISAEHDEEGIIVTFDFPFWHSPEYGILYWGVYHSPDDVPIAHWTHEEMWEEDGVYVQANYTDRYETEKITDYWYYYQVKSKSIKDDNSLYRKPE